MRGLRWRRGRVGQDSEYPSQDLLPGLSGVGHLGLGRHDREAEARKMLPTDATTLVVPTTGQSRS